MSNEKKRIKTEITKNIIGKKITDIYLVQNEITITDDSKENLVVVELENGISLHAHSDDEYQNVGCLVASGIKTENNPMSELGIYLNHQVEDN
jgi:uncharacterized protein YbgA (DUF1722 family)